MAIKITANFADLALHHGRSIGIFNLAMGLLRKISEDERYRISIFGNQAISSEIPSNVSLINKNWVLKSRLARVFWEQIRLPLERVNEESDILLLPKGISPILLKPHGKVIAYIHDGILRFYRDRYPAYLPRIDRFYTMRSIEASIRRADLVIVNTEFTAAEVRKWAREINIRPPKIHVVGIGFDSFQDSISSNFNTSDSPESRILLVTGPAPHKLPLKALVFLRDWEKNNASKKVVISVLGKLPQEASGLMDSHMKSSWRFFSGLSNAQVSSLMAESSTLVFFSEYEGFGMPPVEGLLQGAVPVYSNIPALCEVMSGTGMSFKNDDFSSFVDAMNRSLATDKPTIHAWLKTARTRHGWDEVLARFNSAIDSII